MKTKPIVIIMAAYASKALAFVGGGAHGGGGFHGGGFSGGFHGGGFSTHDGARQGTLQDFITVVVVLTGVVLIMAFFEVLKSYQKTAPWLKPYFKRRQQRFINKCRFPVATPKKNYDPVLLAKAKHRVEKKAMDRLAGIKQVNHQAINLEEIKQQAAEVFCEFEQAWMHQRESRLRYLCGSEKYLNKLLGQINAFQRLELANYIRDTKVDELVLLSINYHRYSNQTTGRISIKGSHVDEYLTRQDFIRGARMFYKKKPFNAVMHCVLSKSGLKVTDIRFDRHVDDVLMSSK